MATLVDSVAEVFPFEALSGTTASFTQGTTDRYLFGGACWAGFGPPAAITALKYGGSGGTDITPGGAAEVFFFGNSELDAGSAAPGPSSSTTIYGASSAGIQGMAAGTAYEGVSGADDYTTDSALVGDTNSTIVSVVVPNCITGQTVTGKFVAVSGNVTIDAFTDDVDTTEILAQDLDTGVTFAAVCSVQKIATSDGPCTIQVRAHSSSAPGTDAIGWAGAAERLIDAEGGPGEYDAAAAQSVDVGDTATAQRTHAAAAAQSVDVGDTAATQLTAGAAATQSVDVGDTASAQRTHAAAAAQSVDVNDTATAQKTVADAAAQSVDVGDTSSAALTLVTAASQAVDVGDTATALSANDSIGAQSVDVGDSATTQATTSAAASQSVDVGDTATTQATVAAAAAQSVDVGDTAAVVGGNVYDLSATDGVDLGDSAASTGVFSATATQAVDVGDVSISAIPSTDDDLTELTEKVDALTLMVQQLGENLAQARTFYVGGPDHNDIEQRMLINREEPKSARIARQNEFILQAVKAVITQER